MSVIDVMLPSKSIFESRLKSVAPMRNRFLTSRQYFAGLFQRPALIFGVVCSHHFVHKINIQYIIIILR